MIEKKVNWGRWHSEKFRTGMKEGEKAGLAHFPQEKKKEKNKSSKEKELLKS